MFASSGPPLPSGTPGRPGSSASSAGKEYGGGGGGGSGSGSGSEAENVEKIAAVAADSVMLEVAAYPAGIFSPPETEKHEHQQRKLRGEGRRRMVLTAESLWKRRRLMHPEAVLADKPPRTLSGWLERHRNDANTLSDGPVGSQDGQAEGAAQEGAGHVGPRPEPGPGAEGSEGDGREAADTAERGMGRKAQEGALDDLVKMVAFGPIGRGDDQPGGVRCVSCFLGA